MSSTRFPGKVLAPFLGRPMIAGVVEHLSMAGLADRLVVLTSDKASDDPLADYVEKRLNVPCFRGDLDNVTCRFQAALAEYEAEWVVRISGDSPIIDGELVKAVADLRGDDFDLVSNVVRRTFPQGQSVECIRASALMALETERLSAEENEHVTLHFYRNAGGYRIRSVVCIDACHFSRHVVDTLDDLHTLEKMVMLAPEQFSGFARRAVVELQS